LSANTFPGFGQEKATTVTRKVSVDSTADASADDLLRFLYDLAFCQPSRWGWAVAGAFAAVPGWLALVSFFDGKTVSCLVFTVMSAVILGLRVLMRRRITRSAVSERREAADETPRPFDIDG
jgi:hypothetical protein